ncbi:T9SS type A sorting domain-containing protein, partial [Pontibacter sp. HSC-14F20]|uniref:T9SS type A sorting domain-containing protein n=1 Tax=Pontibacter sp. HSC-14F20 TaxID=2864136 RepID=UPI001C72C1D1
AAPYALHGDDGRGNYYFGNWNPPATGTYTLTATPYAGANGTGVAGTPLTISFNVVEESGVMANSASKEQRSPEAEEPSYVYPNPTSDGRVKLVVPVAANEQLRYSLLNSIGERLYSGELTKEASSRQVDFDFSEKMKTPGVYFLRMESSRGIKVFKLMKTL